MPTGNEPGSAPEDGGRPQVSEPDNLAHDVNNLAMAIISAANLLQRYSGDAARVEQLAGLLRASGERAVAISDRLRASSRIERPDRVLFVEDDPALRAAFGHSLMAAGLRVTPASGEAEALHRCSRGETFDLLVTELATKKTDGLTLIRRLREHAPTLPALIVTEIDLRVSQLAIEDAALENVILMARPARGEELAQRVAALVEG